MCVFYYRKSVGIESRISLCAIRNKVSVDVFLWFCQCQSGFTVFVTKLLIRQFTLLIYIFTNHYSLYSPLNRVLQILCTYICKLVLHRYSKRTDENTFSDLIPTTKTLCHYFPQLSDIKWSISTIKKSRTLFPDQE